MKKGFGLLGFIYVVTASSAFAEEPLESGAAAAIKRMAGCFLVDYNYHETESLKEGYTLDRRTYDVNRSGKSVKEWIEVIEKSPREIRLQHVLFSTDESSKIVFTLKHQAEDWEFEPRAIYDFEAPGYWKFSKTDLSGGKWVRKVTHLDDGPRYQCVSEWNLKSEFPTWTCKNYAPIPGRETRDMGRKDYQTLDRLTTIVVYSDSWLERQENIKTIDDGQSRTPLAKEVGKNWYVRLPDSQCDAVRDWAKARQPYWNILMNAWDEVYSGQRDIREVSAKTPPRYVKLGEIEEKYFSKLSDGGVSSDEVKKELLDAIAKYIQP